MCRDLELAVPGTYEPHKPVIHIRHVHASLNVITSKQRPRKLCITGECDPEDFVLLVSMLSSAKFLCTVSSRYSCHSNFLRSLILIVLSDNFLIVSSVVKPFSRWSGSPVS